MSKPLSTDTQVAGSIFAPILKRVLDKEMRREHGSLGGIGVIGLIVLVVLAIALWAIGAYNNFVRLKNLVSEGWSGIEVQLKRRSNLVPNLVATVKGYAEHESSVFEEVTQARASIGRGSVGEQAAAESNMAKSLMNLLP